MHGKAYPTDILGFCSVRKHYIEQIFLGFVMYMESYMQMYIIGLCYASDSQQLYRAARNIEIF